MSWHEAGPHVRFKSFGCGAGQHGMLIAPKTVRVYASQSANHPALFAEGVPRRSSGHAGFRKAGDPWVLDKPRVALQPSVVEAA